MQPLNGPSGLAAVLYRLYRVTKDDHIDRPSIEIEAETDAAARELAKQYIDGQALELWQGTQVIARFKASSDR